MEFILQNKRYYNVGIRLRQRLPPSTTLTSQLQCWSLTTFNYNVDLSLRTTKRRCRGIYIYPAHLSLQQCWSPNNTSNYKIVLRLVICHV